VLVVEACRSATPALLRAVLLLLAALANSQEQLRELPDKALAYLARVRASLPAAAQLPSSRTAQLSHALQLVAPLAGAAAAAAQGGCRARAAFNCCVLLAPPVRSWQHALRCMFSKPAALGVSYMQATFALASVLPLVQSPGLVDELAAMSERGLRLQRFLGLLAGAALRALPADPAQQEPLLLGLLTKTRLGACTKQQLCPAIPRVLCLSFWGGGADLLGKRAGACMACCPASRHRSCVYCVLAVPSGPVARGLAEEVLRQAAATYGDGEDGAAAAARRGPLLRLLRALDLRCPTELDAAVDALLPPQAPATEAATEAAAMDTDGGPAGDDAQQAQHAGDERPQQGAEGGGGAAAAPRQQEQGQRRRLLAALQEAFEGTARCPLDAAGTTVLLAAEAPSAAVRQLVSAAPPFFYFFYFWFAVSRKRAMRGPAAGLVAL
jgi:hypothetical protein